LPSAQSLFTGGATTTTPAPASTTPVTGPTVSGPGGTTALPSASPADFQGVNPTPLDQPHPQYPALIQSHVAVLQAIGTPESVLLQLNQSQPAADYMDRYIQGEIMQNPEGWDAYVGNPTGTARAGLQQLIPGVQLPSPGAGTPGVMPDGSRVDGVNVPGVTQPLVGPQQSSGEGLIKGLVIAAAAVGVGLLAWKFIKNRNAAKDAAQLLTNPDQAKGLAALAGGEGANGAAGLQKLVEVLKGGGSALGQSGDEAGEAAQRLLQMQAVVGGGANTAGSRTAATLDAILRGFGPADGFAHQAGITAAIHNRPYDKVANLMLADRGMGVLEQLAKNGGTIADLAAARALTAQLAGAAGQAANAGATTQLAGLRQALAGLANIVV
jgi:hypothetical protein